MKVIIESHIPYVPEGFLSGVADIRFLPPEAITPEAVRDASALIVRTRTRCNAALLDGSAVRFVATATIGTDHIDFDYCRSHGITTVSAPGCNAPAVAQYVWASILTILAAKNPRRVAAENPESSENSNKVAAESPASSYLLPLTSSLSALTIGIVGLGHVGAIVADWARQLGVKVLACDPPRQQVHGGWNPAAPAQPGAEPFVTLDRIAAEADIITFHTPHTLPGTPFATHHLADSRFFNSLRRQPIVINAARGPIVDTEAILSAFEARQISASVIDCWEGEPAISAQLLALSAIATPHIAGYSVEGKQRATHAVLSALLEFIASTASPNPLLKEGAAKQAGNLAEIRGGNFAANLAEPPAMQPPGCVISPESILASYNPLADTEALRRAPNTFEALRNHYPLRHEVGQ
jgi:erythronate-4-phosphate dehydrogenase